MKGEEDRGVGDADRQAVASERAEGGCVHRALRIDPRIRGFLAWLADRWHLSAEAVAAEALSLAVLGRLRTERLKAQGALESRWTFAGREAPLMLRWPVTCDEALAQRAAISGEDVERAGLALLRLHLVGRLRPAEVSLPPLSGTMPPLTDDDVSLSLHLPDSLMARLTELESLVDLARNDIVRDTLLLHVVGRIRYEQWTGQGLWRPRRKASLETLQAYEDGEIRFSRKRSDPVISDDASGEQDAAAFTPGGSAEARRTEFIRAHGKNLNAVRVHLPAWMKQALEELAAPAREPMASYCRRALVAEI